MSAIEATDVEIGFGTGDARAKVLRGARFKAEAGELTFLVGPSGCGKTTLVSILAAMLQPNAGKVSVFGTDLGKLSGSRLTGFRSRTVGFVFQQFNLLPALDAAENAAVPLIVQGTSPAAARKKAVDLLDRLGLSAAITRFPAQLSGGQQQRVAIARALIHNPQLIICDEPTASLDASSGRTVLNLLRDVAVSAERAAIVVTHDDRIYPFADRIAEMADGRVIRISKTKDQNT